MNQPEGLCALYIILYESSYEWENFKLKKVNERIRYGSWKEFHHVDHAHVQQGSLEVVRFRMETVNGLGHCVHHWTDVRPLKERSN